MPWSAAPLEVIVYVPTFSPETLATVYVTVSFPNVPSTVAVNSGSTAPYTFVLSSAVTVTAFGSTFT